MTEEEKEYENDINQSYRGLNDEGNSKYALYQNIDPLKAMNVSTLKFSPSASNLLLEIYEAVKELKFKSISDFYNDRLKEIIQFGFLAEDNTAYLSKQKKTETDLKKYFKFSMDSRELMKKLIKIFESINFLSILSAID